MTAHYFIVPGNLLASIRKELKPALPKKRQEASYLVVITATEGNIKIAIPGAATNLPATTSGPFIAELPYLQFKFVLEGAFQGELLVKCELAPGYFCVNGMATKSPHIIVQTGKDDLIANPVDAPIGLPLLAAYKYIRQYGIHQFTASKTFASQQKEVDALLNKADRLLRPVGITRSDLEHILDKKVG